MRGIRCRHRLWPEQLYILKRRQWPPTHGLCVSYDINRRREVLVQAVGARLDRRTT